MASTINNQKKDVGFEGSSMTPVERRAVISLSSIMSLRMLGLFAVLPVFSLYAQELVGASSTTIGFALGVYGLAQALFQIPFGVLSDRFGRKPIIFAGLVVFILGSILSGIAHSIVLMTIGRALQGMGAIGSTLMACMADFTREEQRTKAMAVAGITIGFSFSLAMFLGPLLIKWTSIPHLFFLAALLGVISIFILFVLVPTSQVVSCRNEKQASLSLFHLFISPELFRLNIGIFLLHAIFTASFLVFPMSLRQHINLEANQQWMVYLPSLLMAFILTLVGIGMAEKKQRLKTYFLSGISALILGECMLWLMPQYFISTVIGMSCFLTGFSLLEAFLPSLISRTAPVAHKGSALGIYSCLQFSGIFVGGALGGYLLGRVGYSGVYFFCISLALLWLSLAGFMKAPRILVTQAWPVLPSHNWEVIVANLQVIPGMVEVSIVAEEGVAYLKMERRTLRDPDYIRLKQTLQKSI